MEICCDLWLDNDGKAFGEECLLLLEAVDRMGSLRKAAAEVNLSYRTAFNMLKESEERLGFALMERKIGCLCGGGSCLTPRAREFTVQYRLFTDEVLATIRGMGSFT
jgi:molybdate transport system regulatory protein